MIQTRSEIEQPKQANNNVLGIAQVVCKRLNRALDFVNQHRVHLLMKGLCRAVSHLMVRARLPCSPLSKKIAHASWDALKVLIACGIVIVAPPCSTIFILSGLATTNA